jgi:hypothetical protein
MRIICDVLVIAGLAGLVVGGWLVHPGIGVLMAGALSVTLGVAFRLYRRRP